MLTFLPRYSNSEVNNHWDFAVNGQLPLSLCSEQSYENGWFSKVILCLQKIRSKNLGQNQDNLKNFLVKDYEYSPEPAENLIDEGVQANILESIMLNGKFSYRIVKTDSADNSSISASQADNSEDERIDVNTTSLEKIQPAY